MAFAQIVGKKPLLGTVTISGSKNSALKLIHAAMYSNEDVVLDNVPKMDVIDEDLNVLRSLGAKAEWIGINTLVLSGGGLNTYEVERISGANFNCTTLLAGPLLYRFGKAILPFPREGDVFKKPVNRWVETWNSLGIKSTIAEDHIMLEVEKFKAADINFKANTHSGTDNAIISSLFIDGETVIRNAAEETEVDDLIGFANQIGAFVERIEPRVIRVVGTTAFKGTRFVVQPDKNDAVFYATAAVLTNGSIPIRNVRQPHLLSFSNILSKLGCNYEFVENELKVWSTSTKFEPQTVTVTHAPAVIAPWLQYITLLFSRAEGISRIYDTVYTNSFRFLDSLALMGISCELKKPSEVGLDLVVNDDSYDLKKSGEPRTVALIHGPTDFISANVQLNSSFNTAALLVAALCAEGVSTIENFEKISRSHENLIHKLSQLGAQIDILS